MYIIISPSKSQDFSRDFSKEKSSGVVSEKNFSVSEFNEETKKLSKIMKSFSKKDLEKTMKISPKLAELNFERFQKWSGNFLNRRWESGLSILGEREDKEYFNFSPAIFALTGDVYRGFDLESWKEKDFLFAEKTLGILSGFYGLLSPLNFLKPYRLEMGTKKSFELSEKKYKNLYEFWEDKITQKVISILKKEKVLVNLASVEYSKSINRKKISNSGGEILDIDFKTSKDGLERIVAIFAKRARGDMANWIIRNRIKDKDDLKSFSVDGWKFSVKSSSENKFVFIKKKDI